MCLTAASLAVLHVSVGIRLLAVHIDQEYV